MCLTVAYWMLRDHLTSILACSRMLSDTLSCIHGLSACNMSQHTYAGCDTQPTARLLPTCATSGLVGAKNTATLPAAFRAGSLWRMTPAAISVLPLPASIQMSPPKTARSHALPSCKALMDYDRHQPCHGSCSCLAMPCGTAHLCPVTLTPGGAPQQGKQVSSLTCTLRTLCW